MQEEVEQKTVNLAVTTTKLTGRVAVKAIAWYLRHRKEKKLEKANEIPHGKQSVKELIGQNAGVSTIDVSKTGLRDFERIAKKYNVDFAVTKDKKVDPLKYVIFFKARDADALNQVVKEYSATNTIQRLYRCYKLITDDGTPCDGKLSRTVWRGGKTRGGNTRGLPIAIRADTKV